MSDSKERPATAPLFDAALLSARLLHGSASRPVRITIRTDTDLEVVFTVPHWWEVEIDSDHPKLTNPTAVADVLATMVEIGHRMTREELCQAMEEKGRKRAESVVADVLAQLMRFGVVDNKQTRAPKGYGLAGE